MPRWSGILACLLVAVRIAAAQEESAPPVALPESAADLFEKARPAVVVVSVGGRGGGSLGVGSGFIISKEGLVVTNRHVVGEGRDISVRLADGREVPVRSIHATSSEHDLAVLQLEGEDFPHLELGDSSKLAPGEPVIAIGNPHGLSHSVVTGVVSAKRDIDRMPVIQIAMPIEPGNSGGPLLDREARAVGVITMKSLVTANLGFAIEIDALKPLLEHPNPVPMSKWRTIGALDPTRWTIHLGSDWRQHAGRLMVRAPGEGFGGRSLCLWHDDSPEGNYELAVTVRLADESGAAGLVFAADDADRHYGFYPSGGSLRLTRFDGPDVFSWSILADVAAPEYVPGDWNRLKVRVESKRIICSVNDEPVIEYESARFHGRRVGLTKFRDTEASFRDFEIGTTTRAVSLRPKDDPERSKLVDRVAREREYTESQLEPFLAEPEQEIARLRREAREREAQASRLRRIANRVHEATVRRELVAELAKPEEEIDLLRGALLIARLDNDEVYTDGYLAEVDRMAEEIRASLADGASESDRLAAIDTYLFAEHGYHGSRSDYRHRSNSYINEVIDDREGLPITLSVLYIELARRLNVPVVGIGLPGHFVVRHEPPDGPAVVIDVFDRAQRLTAEQVGERLTQAGVLAAGADDFRSSKSAILVRMLNNLLGVARDERDLTSMRRYLDAILDIAPDTWEAHWQRGVILLELGERDRAASDARWLMDHPTDELDEEAVRRLFELATTPAAPRPSPPSNPDE